MRKGRFYLHILPLNCLLTILCASLFSLHLVYADEGSSFFSKDIDSYTQRVDAAKARLQEAVFNAYQVFPSEEEWNIFVSDLSFSVSAYAPTALNENMDIGVFSNLFTAMAAICNEKEKMDKSELVDDFYCCLLGAITDADPSDSFYRGALQTIMGDGDPEKGIDEVNSFCQDIGFHNTFISVEGGHTSVLDVGRLIECVYMEVMKGPDAPDQLNQSIWSNSGDKPTYKFTFDHAGTMLILLNVPGEEENPITAGIKDCATIAMMRTDRSLYPCCAVLVYDADNGQSLAFVMSSDKASNTPSAQQTLVDAANVLYSYYYDQ